MAVFGLLDDYDRDEEGQSIDADAASIEDTIRELHGRESADVFLLKDGKDVTETERWLSVATSRGRYAVIASLGEGRPASFMGEPGAQDEVEFAFACQFTSWPARFCVGLEHAVALALSFIESDGEFAEPGRWYLEPDKDRPAF
jgi:hypothetical protein